MTKREQGLRATRLRRIAAYGSQAADLLAELRHLIAAEAILENEEREADPVRASLLNGDSSARVEEAFGRAIVVATNNARSAAQKLESLGAPVKHSRNRQRSKPAPDPTPEDGGPALFELFGSEDAAAPEGDICSL